MAPAGKAMTADDTISGEAGIIEVLRPLATSPWALGLWDDCAALTPLPGTDIVLKTDPIAEGVHFLPGDAPEDIAWKALAVNVSDLAAKAARPLAYLLALSLPAAPRRNWLERFAKGLGEAQACFGITLIGGDTDRRPGPITISVTVLGEVPTGQMVRRAAARPGDVLFVSGTLGDAYLGLRLCLEPNLGAAWNLSQQEQDSLRQRYLRPQPRLALREALRAHASAAMDLSDGLVKDLARMVRASVASAEVSLPRLPLSPAALKAVAAEPALLTSLATSGDDYEVLAAVAADKAEAFACLAASSAIPLTSIGCIHTASVDPVVLRDAQSRPVTLGNTGWDHF